MDYQKFKEQFVEDVKRTLYEKGITDVEITVNQVDKMNESYEALTARHEENNVGVNFHLEDYFEAYADGVDYQNVVSRAVTNIEEHVIDLPAFDLNTISNYEMVKERLSLEIVSAERNAKVLEYVPHKLLEDMAIVYRINLEFGGKENATVLVNNHLLEMYGISQEQLHVDAERNAAIIKPVIIRGMSDVMMELMGLEATELFGVQDMGVDEMMYIATVPDKVKGAGVLAYDSFLDCAAEKLGGDFFVLPSSVHEILLVKDDGKTTYEDLKETVLQVNATEIKPEEKLTDSVYHYDSKNHVFELGEKYEARRQQDRTAQKAEKGSVLKDLKEKQESVAEKTIEKSVSKNRGGEAL